MSSRPSRERSSTKRFVDEAVPEEPKKRAKKKASKKEKGGKKDPNKPKRALSGYMFFMNENRARIKEENPDATFGELGKLAGAEWGEMSAADKKPYNDMNKKDKKRYEKEMEGYEASE